MSGPMIGDEIRNARLSAGLSQEELASQADVHRTYVSLLERNRKSPTLAVLLRICDALGVSAARMVERVEKGCDADH